MSGNFIVYLLGYIIAIVGVAYGLSAAGLGQQWIVAVVLVMAGLGIVYALSRAQRDRKETTARAGDQVTVNTSPSEPPPRNRPYA